jgi:predicted dehydrogenase
MKSKIAVIGAGTYGMHILKALSVATEEGMTELVALAEIDPDRLEQATQKFQIRGYQDYTEMLDRESLDAVAVVTPDYLHRDIALAAFERKLHVMCQKPIATSVSEGQIMIDAAQQTQVMLYVDYHKRFDPSHQALKHDIQEGRLGSILYGDVHMEDRIEVPSVWFKKWAEKSSPAWFLGNHFYDLVSWMMQSRPVRVFAYGNKKKLKGLGIDTYDHVSAQVVYDNEATVTYHASWILPDSFPSIVNQQIRMVGTEGICEIDSQDRGMTASYAGDSSCQVVNPFSRFEYDDDPYGLSISGYSTASVIHFVRLLGKIKSKSTLLDLRGCYPSGEEALIATELCEAIHRSLDQNTLIDLC